MLPLPGRHVRFPANAIGTLYRQYLAYDGTGTTGGSEHGWAVEKAAGVEHVLYGSYRRLICRPKHLEWQSVCYSRSEQLLYSDPHGQRAAVGRV